MPRITAGDMVEVDPTWGHIQPIELAPGVKTIGELELIAHIEAGLPLVDTRMPELLEQGTIPGAVSLPHVEINSRLTELDPETTTAFFCNGPQCVASPDAVGKLLAAGFPARSILYYRGGIHDWMTLGLPVAPLS